MNASARRGHHGGSASEITAWVQQNFTPFHVGDATVYDLSAGKQSP